jgi:hypothetical protein
MSFPSTSQDPPPAALPKYEEDGPLSRNLDRAVSKFIVDGYMPYSVVEVRGFRDMLASFDSRYRVKSRGFYAETDIPKMYADMKMELRHQLSTANFVSLTADDCL